MAEFALPIILHKLLFTNNTSKLLNMKNSILPLFTRNLSFARTS